MYKRDSTLNNQQNPKKQNQIPLSLPLCLSVCLSVCLSLSLSPFISFLLLLPLASSGIELQKQRKF